MMHGIKGMVSTGSKEASESAAQILKLGGNAFDAAISAVLTSMTSEVNLTSLAGGGAMLTYIPGQKPVLFDFFVDAPPIANKKNNFEFYEVKVDFGATEQLFHIGKGSIAIPGNIKGLIHVHNRLGKLPLHIITEPAIELAKKGVKLSKSQSYITSLLHDILQTSSASRKLFYKDDKLVSEGDYFVNSDLAETLTWITEEGDRPFYEGELGKRFIDYIGDSGIINMVDLNNYQVYERYPLQYPIMDNIFFTNPSPSVGGILIIFLYKLLYKLNSEYKFNNNLLIKLMSATTMARYDYYKNPDEIFQLEKLLDEGVIHHYSNMIKNGKLLVNNLSDNGLGSTTHVSIMDKDGNAASITTTNGESCGHVLPGTGIILNNMLGEEDLNPLGFHNWKERRRMPTLISPSILIDKEGCVKLVLGSAGSNRIRSAIIQVMSNFLIKGYDLEKSIYSSRIHLEGTDLHLEPGIREKIDLKGINNLKINEFSDINLFFGGVNAVSMNEAVADPRRGGSSLVC